MAFLLKGKKEDLIALAKQFGVSVESDLTKPKIKDLILKSEDYDEEDAKVMLDSIIEDRHLAEVEKQNEREERLRKEKREHELEKLRIQAQRNPPAPMSRAAYGKAPFVIEVKYSNIPNAFIPVREILIFPINGGTWGLTEQWNRKRIEPFCKDVVPSSNIV
ncbi:hypothetical protein HNY73_004306 [Argiope bruennichi]|uniref:Uncharacterized protein n=1 Tax=Argiope bruennichi TaxID=94029 RepID=A0A8T0FT95_ARGBR|nr:hypothetical protein HNY73_004306 [Argiope bruennichi]